MFHPPLPIRLASSLDIKLLPKIIITDHSRPLIRYNLSLPIEQAHRIHKPVPRNTFSGPRPIAGHAYTRLNPRIYHPH